MLIKKNKSTFDSICGLVGLLNKASDLYYNTGQEYISDEEYDFYYERLKDLENSTGFILSNSPTQNVGSKVVSLIPKVKHEYPMLSLDKCHSIEEIENFIGNDDCFISLKLDGLSVRLVYKDGKLSGIFKRGDGETGSDITHLASAFSNIPQNISVKRDFIIDGEAIITYKSFEEYKKKTNEDYKNPRNLASGTLGMLDADDAKNRGLQFVAWRVVKGLTDEAFDSVYYKLEIAKHTGFTVVPSFLHYASSPYHRNLNDMILLLKHTAEDMSYPIDGIVIAKDSIELAESLGRTNKFYKHSLAYKFDDQAIPTKLKFVEWTIGKTGVLTPTAVFDPVEIEGTKVEKASVHNVSIMRMLDLKDGCTCYVKKANMIIPQIQKCEGGESPIDIPLLCPYCGSETVLENNNNTITLVCNNDECSGRKIKELSHFVSKKGMDIEGLSEATISKFVKNGWIHKFSDIYRLGEYTDEMQQMEGFGVKSVYKILQSIILSRKCMLDKFICALSIPTVGQSQARVIAEKFNYDQNLFYEALKNRSDFSKLDGFGIIANANIYQWFDNTDNQKELEKLMNTMSFNNPKRISVKPGLTGKTFVITGKLSIFKNRNDLKEKILAAGGKVSGSVSKNTYALINNDTESKSSKNQKAKELDVKILSEGDIEKLLNE
ncbi:MAG: NAD-dependent DNA ligase LigA [Anaerostipes sp.]|uniref:NAD-dependent DNA ligase LigA n=1 Tax=Anaerostipes sp. TaxID=1872530 RepID=UPI003992466C